MIKQTILFLSILSFPLLFWQCSKADECEELREDRYLDITDASFSVNGSERMYQNYSAKSYKDDPSKALVYTQLFSGTDQKQSLIRLYFTRIDFKEECTPYRKHVFSIDCFVDQFPGEEVTYNIGNAAQPRTQVQGHATYLEGELLEEGEILRTSRSDAGTFTITNYVANERLTGHYNIEIDGIHVEGEMDYDLTKYY